MVKELVIIVEATTYHATLHSPLFYSSSEGVLISADRILGSTALTYSLAYNLGLLKKHYFLFGEGSGQSSISGTC
jgi:hypothetical protein